jgi:hypothetical protein
MEYVIVALVVILVSGYTVGVIRMVPKEERHPRSR